MPASSFKTTKQTDATPATHTSWRFGDLPAAALLPQLQRHLQAQNPKANWQLVWLNNDGQPVIGLLPKTSWSLYVAADDSAADNNNEQTPAYTVVQYNRDSRPAITTTHMSYLEWQAALIAYSHAYAEDCQPLPRDDHNGHNDHSDHKLPRYHHGLIGFIGYDVAAHELSPTGQIAREAQPCAVLGHYDIYLTTTTQHGHTKWQLTCHRTDSPSAQRGTEQKTDADNTQKLITDLIASLNSLEQKLSDNRTAAAADKSVIRPAPLRLNVRWHKSDYQRAFERTQAYLLSGDCYQINLTQAWTGHLAPQPPSAPPSALIDYLPALHLNTNAPFAGYMQVATPRCDGVTDTMDTSPQQFEIVSCSPELFFTFYKDPSTGNHQITTKPIKGTMPRGSTVKQDRLYKQQLIDSEKDRAENVMIVDLLRNDLGKYAKIGSVKVPQLFAIESFSNVHHMVSTVKAELHTDTHPLAVLFGSLPAGSITGTPKKRAVEIISELEAAPRGAYCGTMGYMNFDGSGQWNVLIRTLQATHQRGQTAAVSLWAGGGVTVASSCDAEYQECLDKVGNLLSVLAQ